MTPIKELPILFSAPMVRAIREGMKVVTRRPVKGQYLEGPWSVREAVAPQNARHTHDWWLPDATQPYAALPACPYGVPGDLLWVRESFWQAGEWVANYPEDDTGSWAGTRRVHYRADGTPPNEPNDHYPEGLRNGAYSAANPARIWRARPSIHMPRWASRILLQITDIRVERLHDISRSEIRSEGLQCPAEYSSDDVSPNYRDWYPAAFRELWKSTGGNWEANPWVWVIQFKQVASTVPVPNRPRLLQTEVA
uniref:Phage-related protein n=1 Tax=Pseudomonas syringae pv. actinidiae TaxID=103796 RepID=A0A7L7TMR4_PSESF|nr:hypothetical protein [Pseudomonas syringae]QOC74129.1 Phage-related protein [Pseudomonas syringae pv. actinidiae]